MNALLGIDVAAVGRVRAGDAKGRHTTTTRHLHPMPGGGTVIDTPGIRSIGLWVDPDAVDAAFADIDELAEGCRFGDCAHDAEPGCAVRQAVAAGGLDHHRLQAWQQLRDEAASSSVRAPSEDQRGPGRATGKVARLAQRRKRPRG